MAIFAGCGIQHDHLLKIHAVNGIQKAASAVGKNHAAQIRGREADLVERLFKMEFQIEDGASAGDFAGDQLPGRIFLECHPVGVAPERGRRRPSDRQFGGCGRSAGAGHLIG